MNDITERLRGNYSVKVNDGAGLLDGKDTFERKFETPPIQHEAATEIERLRTWKKEAEETLARNNILMSQGSEKIDELVDTRNRHESWVRQAKEDAGFHRNESFDIVWDYCLRSYKVIQEMAKRQPDEANHDPRCDCYPCLARAVLKNRKY